METMCEATVTDKDGICHHVIGSWTECLEFCEEIREKDETISIEIRPCEGNVK